ncbi:TPA: ead/Ea22-like family protein [Citrobacter freundii]
MTALNKQALREYYSPQPVPKCHICGAEMTVQRMSASRITYGCTGATYDDKGCHYAIGRSIADDHYEESRVTVVDVSDPDVLAMLDELEATESKCRELAVENVTLNDKMNKLATWPGIEFYSSAWEFCNLDGNDALEFMCDVKTPATDAFLAEVRAQGVEMMAAEADQLMNELGDDSYKVMVTADLQRFANAFAAQLRKGAAL